MLGCVRRLRGAWFGKRAGSEGGVLVKAAKLGQDLRVDMPAIGPRTVVEVARAGLSGIAMGAESTLLLEQDESLHTADRLRVFLVVVDPGWRRAMPESLTVWIVCGEESGDQLGKLMRALKARLGADRLRFGGVGGQAMANEGLNNLFPLHDITVMGFPQR